MMYDIAAITALMEVDGGAAAAAAVGDGDGLAVSWWADRQTDRHSRDGQCQCTWRALGSLIWNFVLVVMKLLMVPQHLCLQM